eukprot:42066-Pyramimonas_sp.AAC.1
MRTEPRAFDSPSPSSIQSDRLRKLSDQSHCACTSNVSLCHEVMPAPGIYYNTQRAEIRSFFVCASSSGCAAWAPFPLLGSQSEMPDFILQV